MQVEGGKKEVGRKEGTRKDVAKYREGRVTFLFTN